MLAEYIAQPQPRYAPLIHAPWGAGKTEFIKKETSYETDTAFLYLSLFGLNTAQAFGEALLGAILRAPGDGLEKRARAAAERVKNVVSGSQVMGVSINLSSLSVLEGLRTKLRATFIFDDLERSGMPQLVILGKEQFAFEDAIQKLAGTHLALHMAYSGGKIDKDAL